MDKTFGIMVMATSLLLGSCKDVNVGTNAVVDEKPLITRSDIKIAEGRMTPEAL